jgi:hypothetical protein
MKSGKPGELVDKITLGGVDFVDKSVAWRLPGP